MCTDLCSQVIYFPSYAVCLSSFLGATKGGKKWSEEDVYCNNGAETGWAWPGARHIFPLCSTFSIICRPVFRQTDSYSPNQSPLIGEITFMGMVQSKVSSSSFFMKKH